MKLLKQIILTLLSIIIGGTFLYSAWTKTIPIQTFEYTIVEYVKLPWFFAAIAARLLIGLEAALGALMILHLYGCGKWVLKFSIGILLVFSVYLIYLWIAAGDDVNCGCFGDAIWMSPSQSLIKNAIMIALLLLLIYKHCGFPKRIANIISIIVMVVVTALPMILYGIPAEKPNWLRTEKYQLDFSAPEYPASIKTGKHVVAFVSLTCPHCKIAAYKMHLMKNNNPALPFFLVLNGDDEKLEAFWKETKAQDIPNTMVKGEAFVKNSGFSLPAIFLINDGWVEAQVNYVNLNQADIETWLREIN